MPSVKATDYSPIAVPAAWCEHDACISPLCPRMSAGALAVCAVGHVATFSGGCYDDKGSQTSIQETGTVKMVFV